MRQRALQEILDSKICHFFRQVVRRSYSLILYGIFLGTAGFAQSSGSIPVFRHHVIFLLDGSGSVLTSPCSLGEYRSVVQKHLPSLLENDRINGFGIKIYDPNRDLSTAFVFGLSQDSPFFAPQLKNGFMRHIWFQERGKTYEDLAESVPEIGLHWTAFDSAFSQAIRKVRWESQEQGDPPRAFERTFLVMVSDGKQNITKSALDEIRGIHVIAAADFGHDMQKLETDAKSALGFHGNLVQLYSFPFSSGFEEAGQGALGFPAGHYRIFIRELVPLPLASLLELLSLQPDREIELKRQGYGKYVNTIRLAPARTKQDGIISYSLARMDWKGPGDRNFNSIPIPTQNRPFVCKIALFGEQIKTAEAKFRLGFLRKDPVYGQALQIFEETIRFRPEPRKQILGMIPITDAMMVAHPGLSQDQIIAVDSVLLFLLAAGLIWVLFLPASRAALTLSRPAGSPACLVDFNLSRHRHQFFLGEIHLQNYARRMIRLGSRTYTLPRLAERRFNLDIQIKTQLPKSIVTTERPLIGLKGDLAPDLTLKRQTAGSIVPIIFSSDGVSDYRGNPHESVDCQFTVEARQPKRHVWGATRWLQLEPRAESFQLRFIAEEPRVQARLKPGMELKHTGETENRAFPRYEGVPGWLVRPHWRGGDKNPSEPEFFLEMRNAVSHFCSKPGSAEIHVVMFRINEQGLLLGKGIDIPIDPERQKIKEIKFSWKNEWPERIPIFLDYEMIPVAPDGGDDYIVVATLIAADGQGWGTQEARYGIRIGPDPRKAALRFKVATEVDGKGNLMWHSHDPMIHSDLISISAAEPARWSIGQTKEVQTLAWLEIDNVARTGDGSVTLQFGPDAAIGARPPADPALGPAYQTDARSMIGLKAAGDEIKLGNQREWTIHNEQTNRPVRIAIEFNPYAIEKMERGSPRYQYRCRLPLHSLIRETAASLAQEASFQLQLDFDVKRFAGQYVLAVDFGTSAVVTAFEQDELNIFRRVGDFSGATLNLQSRYAEIMEGWGTNTDVELQNEYNWERDAPNLESGSGFLPSAMVLRDGRQVGKPDFLFLPGTLTRIAKEWERTVYNLKALILRGDQYLPVLPGLEEHSLRWVALDGSSRPDANEKTPPVDGIIGSAYRNLLTQYIEPILKRQAKDEYLTRLVVAHPNSFTLSHIHRIRKILKETFRDFDQIDLLSESNAVALYSAHEPNRFFEKLPSPGDCRNLLVYDIGAGTLDLTYTRIEWFDAASTVRQEIKVLFKIGLQVAGNRLDECFAKVIDGKIRWLIEKLAGAGITLTYQNPIVDPPHYDAKQYAQRMVALKRAIHALKVELSTQGEDQTYHVEINASQDHVRQIATFEVPSMDKAEEFNRKLDDLSITRGGLGAEMWIGIPLLRKEILEYPEVIQWLNQVTDGIMLDLAGALQTLGIKPQIDTLVMSGRTAEFPTLRDRLVKAIKTHLGLDESGYYIPSLTYHEKKESVALGSLLYPLFHGKNLRFVDQNVWAKYGVIYRDSVGPRFREAFSYASKPGTQDRRIEQDGHATTLFNRTITIEDRAGGNIQIAATFSKNPEQDIRDRVVSEDKFIPIHTFGLDLLPPGKVEIQILNEENDTITVNINPNGIGPSVNVRGYRPDADIAQMKWPYKMLTGTIEWAPQKKKSGLADKPGHTFTGTGAITQ